MRIRMWHARLRSATAVRHARKPAVSSSTARLCTPRIRPTQRANSCPKVANPFCRLPLPTFFHQLEAAHLGDLLRLWVRRAVRAMLAQIFKGRSARAKRSTKVRALPAMATISPLNAIPWYATAPAHACASAAKWLSRKGEISSRGALRRLWARLRCRLSSTCSRWNVSQLPFRGLEALHCCCFLSNGLSAAP